MSTVDGQHLLVAAGAAAFAFAFQAAGEDGAAGEGCG